MSALIDLILSYIDSLSKEKTAPKPLLRKPQPGASEPSYWGSTLHDTATSPPAPPQSTVVHESPPDLPSLPVIVEQSQSSSLNAKQVKAREAINQQTADIQLLSARYLKHNGSKLPRRKSSLRERIQQQGGMRQALIMKEILDRPISLRENT